MAPTYHELKEKTLAQLREIAKGIQDERVQGHSQMNKDHLLPAAEAVLATEKWRTYFDGFRMPWSFYGATEYQPWLREVGLRSERLELIPKQIRHAGNDALAAWIRTTWLPYLQRVPGALQAALVDEIVAEYTRRHPAGEDGSVCVSMVRLEVEATRG